VKHITKMFKKDGEIRCGAQARQSFMDSKQSLTEAPVLVSPNFNKDFMLFYFSPEHTIVGVLLQKNGQKLEQLIAFFKKP
jgi:hypothetical protein